MNATTTTRRLFRLAPVLACAALAAGCATVTHPTPEDPWESYNRSMFQFNDAVDGAILKPIAQGYEAVTPKLARDCIHNIFNNLGDVWSAFNSFLQGRGHDGINTLGRVLMNTTMGVGGCIDVASMKGVRRIDNDLGVTLGVWGVQPGPYVVLPFLGSSTVRDGTATAASLATDYSSRTAAVLAIEDVPLRNGVLALAAIDLRASLLDADDMVRRIALDRYSFIRDAYLQRRKAQVRGEAVNPDAPYRTGGDAPTYDDNHDLPDYSVDDDEPAPQSAANGS